MTISHSNPTPLSSNDEDNDDNSTVFTGAATPPETIITDNLDLDLENAEGNTSAPWPGSKFLIRAVSSGKLLTLRKGRVVLAFPRKEDSVYWECTETKGWLGFRNTSTARFLGHDKHGKLACFAESHKLWEWFCARRSPDGGYVLLLTNWEYLWHVQVVDVEDGGEVEILAKVGDGFVKGMVWEFIKV